MKHEELASDLGVSSEYESLLKKIAACKNKQNAATFLKKVHATLKNPPTSEVAAQSYAALGQDSGQEWFREKDLELIREISQFIARVAKQQNELSTVQNKSTPFS